MKILKYILLGSLLSVNLLSLAQVEKVSGYLGNRLSIGGGINVSPSSHSQSSMDASTISEDARLFSLNKMWHANLDYVIKKNIQMGLVVGSFNTSIGLSDEDYSNLEWGEHSNYDSYQFELGETYGTPEISTKYLGLSIKKFKSKNGAMAPVGRFISAELNAHFVTYDFSNVRYLVKENVGFGNYEEYLSEHTSPINKATYLELSVYYGRVIPIGDRLLLEWSVGGGFMSSFFLVWYNKSNTRIASPAQMYLEQSSRRLAYAHFLKSGVSLSFLVL